jgi:hypothetical protein
MPRAATRGGGCSSVFTPSIIMGYFNDQETGRALGLATRGLPISKEKKIIVAVWVAICIALPTRNFGQES